MKLILTIILILILIFSTKIEKYQNGSIKSISNNFSGIHFIWFIFIIYLIFTTN